MKKRHLVVIALFVIVMSLVLVVPASACTEGCTPGYWKQVHHFDSWVGYVPTGPDADYFDDVFGVGPHITLLDALSAKRQDFPTGVHAATARHAVAALLNAANDGVAYLPMDDVLEYVPKYWGKESFKDYLAEKNELGCPLD